MVDLTLTIKVTDENDGILENIPVNFLNESGVYDASRKTDEHGIAYVDNFRERYGMWKFTVNIDERLIKTNVDYDTISSDLIPQTSNFVLVKLRKRNFKLTLSLTP